MNVNSRSKVWRKLGDFIEPCEEKNVDNMYNLSFVKGISTGKTFISTKANMDGVSLSSYKIVKPMQFAYVADTSRRGDKIALALNTTEEPVLISSIYTSFRVKDKEELLPEYLYMILCRTEFDRYSRFNSWGSARETFDWDELCNTLVPIPDPKIQQELVDTYNGLKSLAEENEALIEPLKQACNAFICHCKKNYSKVLLGNYIKEETDKNKFNNIKKVLGLSTQKNFREPNSRVNVNEISNYKIVRKNSFAFVPTTDTWKVFACALNKQEDIVVSPIYCVFSLTNHKILEEYLEIFLHENEFDRYARYNSWGSARENFSFLDLCKVHIPLPPVEIQQSVVNLYNCLKEAQNIAQEAREKLNDLCPALIQKAIHS